MSNALDQFYFDVFVTAIEGGINYWAGVDDYHHSVGGGNDDLEAFYAKIFDYEDEAAGYEVSRKTLVRGFANIDKSSLSNDYKNHLKRLYHEKDAGELDAGDADAIVQIGLFGNVMYG